jgi:hypothetical protein
MADLLGNAMIGVCAFVFFAILAGLVLHRIIGWYIEGAVSGLHCALISAAYVGTIALIITVPSWTIRISLFLLLLGLILLLPFFTETLGERNTYAYYEERIEQYRQAIAADPANLAARAALAEALYNQGRLDEAIAEMGLVVQRTPESVAEAHRLKQMQDELSEKKSPHITCPGCGHKNEPGRTRCVKCEGELRMSREIRKWLMAGGLKQIIVTWSITMGICAVVMFALSQMPILIRIWIIAFVLLVVISAEWLHIQRNW